MDKTWPLQLGTLGGGNHFIEVSLDERDHVWLVLHSGSRGIGNKLAMRHIGVAKELMKRGDLEFPTGTSPIFEGTASSTPISMTCAGRRSPRGSTATR